MEDIELIKSSYERHYTKIIEIIYKKQIVGFMILNRVKNKGYAVLDYFGILQRYRNNGIGTKALKMLLDEIFPSSSAYSVYKSKITGI